VVTTANESPSFTCSCELLGVSKTLTFCSQAIDVQPETLPVHFIRWISTLRYVWAALLGALLGGAISLIVSTRSAQRERRARYGESLLRALTAAERGRASAAEPQPHGPVLLEPILLREEAVAVWSFTELASTLESPAARKAMRAWGLQLFEALVHGASNERDQRVRQPVGQLHQHCRG
jgi:hypothetical protein